NLSFTASKSNTDPSIYTATITIPAVSCSTTNIKYCGPPSMFVRRNDGQEFEAHLRASTFGANCSNPTTISCQDQGCTTPPVLSGCPGQSSVTFQCIADVPAAATVTATDCKGIQVDVSFNETQSKPGSSCNNTITRTWTATDSFGNTASCSQTITVNDTTPP